MSAPLSTLFHGSVTIETGCDTGLGSLQVANNVIILGTANGIAPTSGALSIPSGGLSVFRDTYLNGQLTVNSTSNLQTTYIDTTYGPLSVSGGNAVTVSVGGNVSLTTTSGNASLSASTGTTIISSGDNAANAVQITATNNAGGGVTVLSGQSGGLFLTGGSGGIQETTSAGSINLTANNASGSFVVNSSASNQNLTLAQYGTGYSSGVLVTADGAGSNSAAVQILSTNTAGNIVIQNNQTATGTGYIQNNAGAGGFFATTLTGGSIGLTANGANSYFYVNSTGGSGQTLTVGVTGGSYSGNKLILSSNGTNPTQAILITNTSTAGGILLSQPALSNGGVVINTGTGGLTATTQVGGGVNLAGNGGNSSFINNNANLTVCVSQGNLKLCTTGTGQNALSILSTGTSGGIFATAAGSININTSDSTNGINIGTTTTTPVNIGTPSSTTTVYGNLDVRGTTTTIESTTVQITDNIIELNNGPTGTADGGVAIKRYQPAINTCIGDVVADTPEYVGSVISGTATTITLATGQMGGIPVSIPDFTGWWIQITGGTGQCEARRIKSNVSNVLTIFGSADQTNVSGPIYNSVPAEGLDWNAADANSVAGAIPDSTSTYALFPCQWIISMWDSLTKRFILVCSQMIKSSSAPPIAHYIDLQINNLYANAIRATTINGVLADTQVKFNLTDNSTASYELNPTNVGSSFPNPYGIYIVMVRPTTAQLTRTSSIFLIGSLGGSTCGQVARIISVKGNLGDQLDMTWPASGGPYTGYPCIQYRLAPGVVGTTNYTIKIISV